MPGRGGGPMADRRVLMLTGGLLVAALVFLTWQLREPVGFILSLRAGKLVALILVGAATGAATVLFQTVIGNRLLTPGIVGFDALFIFLQTMLVLVLGGIGFSQLHPNLSFLGEAALMTGAALVLFHLLLRRGAQDIARMVLTGIVLGLLFRGLAEFAQRMLEPSQFSIVQYATFASFNSVETANLGLAGVVIALAILAALRLAPALDVAALGRPVARGLGLGYDRVVMQALALVAVLVAAATALVGPMTFLGLIAASLAREVVPESRHALLLPAAAVTGAIILVAGQFLFERLMGQQSALGVIVEFLGGLLFLALVLGRRRL